MEREYVIIHGLCPGSFVRADNRDEALREYIAGIVYGAPRRIFGTVLQSGKFVALVEYEDEVSTAGASTFARIPSFNYGAEYILSGGVESAFQHFGSWVAHYSGHLDAVGAEA